MIMKMVIIVMFKKPNIKIKMENIIQNKIIEILRVINNYKNSKNKIKILIYLK